MEEESSMMRRVIIMFFAISLSVLTLTGCKKKEKNTVVTVNENTVVDVDD